MQIDWESELIEQNVTYSLERDGKIYIVENVPARVNPETGEQFFSPDTVEKLQTILKADLKPKRVIETPVYEFATLRKAV
ncbi:MAG: YgiT-type zinc finger protein [Rhodothermales bacterium]